MSTTDPWFWAAAGAGLATIANVALTSLMSRRDARLRRVMQKHITGALTNDQAMMAAMAERIDMLTRSLERARNSSVKSTEAIEEVEAALGIEVATKRD